MANKAVYQTLEDRNNPDEIEEHGPYPCRRENAWLGNGFYFWDTFINNAHWWGKEGACYNKGYIICKAECDYNTVQCFDLVGETDHIQQFNQSINLMKEKGLLTNKTAVARVINHIKEELKIFKYSAVRVYGINSKAKNSDFNQILYFNPLKPQYLDISPAIQICFYYSNSLSLRNYRIIFPEEYIEGYAV
ncbi:MAG: hypothetical protein EHM93_16450 [Bacteroidales bacterium]|nr:MAG: hypothetical protein EHM93_16450 [Bacteroidales bacterium]